MKPRTIGDYMFYYSTHLGISNEEHTRFEFSLLRIREYSPMLVFRCNISQTFVQHLRGKLITSLLPVIVFSVSAVSLRFSQSHTVILALPRRPPGPGSLRTLPRYTVPSQIGSECIQEPIYLRFLHGKVCSNR